MKILRVVFLLSIVLLAACMTDKETTTPNSSEELATAGIMIYNTDIVAILKASPYVIEQLTVTGFATGEEYEVLKRLLVENDTSLQCFSIEGTGDFVIHISAGVLEDGTVPTGVYQLLTDNTLRLIPSSQLNGCLECEISEVGNYAVVY